MNSLRDGGVVLRRETNGGEEESCEANNPGIMRLDGAASISADHCNSVICFWCARRGPGAEMYENWNRSEGGGGVV